MSKYIPRIMLDFIPIDFRFWTFDSKKVLLAAVPNQKQNSSIYKSPGTKVKEEQQQRQEEEIQLKSEEEARVTSTKELFQEQQKQQPRIPTTKPNNQMNLSFQYQQDEELSKKSEMFEANAYSSREITTIKTKTITKKKLANQTKEANELNDKMFQRPSKSKESINFQGGQRYHKSNLPLRSSCPIFSLETFTKIISLLIATLLVMPVKGLANCPNDCECDDDKLNVTCGEGALDVLPITLNPQIQRLTIRHNKIKTIDSSIQFYSALTFLDLSYNDLVNIPYKTFNFQRNLSELYLKNNKIGQISNRTFAGLMSLRVLNLRGNLIGELEYGSFTPMSKLTFLDLGQNRISTIDPHAFDTLTQLQHLYLDDNTLTTVPADITFKAVPNLEQLFLGINSFITLPPKAFQSLRKLKILNLEGAGLHNISSEAFEGLEGLQFLDLSDNRFEHIPSLAFDDLQNLEVLTLRENDFEIIPSGSFASLKKLKSLEIAGNLRLRRIESQVFSENSNLENLKISSNKMLNDINENAFKGLPNLKNITLSENQLNTLSEGLLPWNDLQKLDLSDNPLICDCRLVWLRNLLLQKNFSDESSNNIVCAYPEKLKDTPLALMTPTLLGCSQTDGSHNARIYFGVFIFVALITSLIILLYAYRRKILNLFTGKWGNTALGHKEQEYQKTFSDEEYMSRQVPHACNFGGQPSAPYAHGTYNPHQTNYMGTCPIPVTEL